MFSRDERFVLCALHATGLYTMAYVPDGPPSQQPYEAGGADQVPRTGSTIPYRALGDDTSPRQVARYPIHEGFTIVMGVLTLVVVIIALGRLQNRDAILSLILFHLLFVVNDAIIICLLKKYCRFLRAMDR